MTPSFGIQRLINPAEDINCQSQKTQIGDHKKITEHYLNPEMQQKTSVRKEYGEKVADSRKEATEKSAEATQKIVCRIDGKDNQLGSGNLIYDNQTVITASHIFRQENSCVPDIDFKTCYFMGKNGEIYKFKDMKTIGECTSQEDPKHIDYDREKKTEYAVIKLEKAVKGIEPYQVDSVKLKEGDEVRVVGAYALNSKLNKPESDGKIHEVVRSNVVFYSADTGPGMSGGAVTAKGNPQVLIGIHEGDARAGGVDGREIDCRYRSNCGKFYKITDEVVAVIKGQ